MQIFRVNEDHEISAAFLDNRRLSKQVLELYQIIRVCLAQKDIIDTNTRYRHHPVVKHVYNNGHPYLHDTVKLLKAMDIEHVKRGGKRSADFQTKLETLYAIIENPKYSYEFSMEKLPPFYVFGDDKCSTEEAYSKYETLLFTKWAGDKIPARCSIKV